MAAQQEKSAVFRLAMACDWRLPLGAGDAVGRQGRFAVGEAILFLKSQTMKGLLLVAVCGLLAGMVFAGRDTGPAKIQRLRSSFLERALDMLDDEDASQQYLDEVVRIQAMQTEADMDQRVTVFEGKITAAMHDALGPAIMADIGDGDSFSEQQLSHIDEAAAILKGQEDRLNAWRESQNLSPVFLRQVNGITYQYPRYISFILISSYLFFFFFSNSLLFLDYYFL